MFNQTNWTLAIGTKNPAKIQAVQNWLKDTGYKREVQSLSVPSCVSDQPYGDKETMTGAVNRAKAAREAAGTTYGIGLEGGLMKVEDILYLCNWGALSGPDHQIFVASGARIPLPYSLAEQLSGGQELGTVIDQYVNKENVRQNEGTIGILTEGAVTRDTMFYHVVSLLFGQLNYQNSAL